MQLVRPDPPINHSSQPTSHQPCCHMLVCQLCVHQTTPVSIYAGEKKWQETLINLKQRSIWVCVCHLHSHFKYSLYNSRQNNSPNCAEAFRRTTFTHRVCVSQCAWEVCSEQFRVETAHEFHYSTKRTRGDDWWGQAVTTARMDATSKNRNRETFALGRHLMSITRSVSNHLIPILSQTLMCRRRNTKRL